MTRSEVNAAFNEAVRWVEQQDFKRGDWPRVRDGEAPLPPWPNPDDPMLDYLVTLAHFRREQRADPVNYMMNLAITAWFEGHIEGYDRAHREMAEGASQHRRPPRALRNPPEPRNGDPGPGAA